MTFRNLRNSALGLLAGPILAVLLSSCGQKAPDAAPKAPPAVQARILEAQPQRVPLRLELVGQVEGSKEVEVRARVSGILQKRLYKEGEVVRAGDPLFEIDPAPYEIALAQARAQLAQERARNDQAKREAGRLKSLADEKAISRREYDDATSALKLSEATLLAVEAGVRQAELNLSYTRVTAPVAGISGRVARSVGSLVSPGTESLLTTINQIDPVWIRFSLSDSDLATLPGGRLSPGAGSDLRLVLPDGTTYAGRGRLNFTATQIDPKLATQQMRAEFDNAKQQLLPGQFVRVTLIAAQRDNAFLVPQPAVQQTEKGAFVFILDGEGKAALRPVKLGPWVGTDWMITDGLKAGDRVIVDNLLKIRPGSPVTPAAADAGKPGAEKTAGNAEKTAGKAAPAAPQK